jgi:hypothetical protein
MSQIDSPPQGADVLVSKKGVAARVENQPARRLLGVLIDEMAIQFQQLLSFGQAW